MAQKQKEQFDVKSLEDGQILAPKDLVFAQEHFLKGNYHFSAQALANNQFVFVENGFNSVPKNTLSRKLRILEMGFGTGLNALLTYKQSLVADVPVYYATVDLNPLPITVVEKLKYYNYFDSNIYQKFLLMHSTPWFTNNCIDNQKADSKCFFELYKIQSDILQLNFDDTYDLVYYDAFSPELQPELWSYEVLFKIFNACNRGAVLVTHATNDSVLYTLENVGFVIETLNIINSNVKMTRAIKK